MLRQSGYVLKTLSELQDAVIEVFKNRPSLVMMDVDYRYSEESIICKALMNDPLTSGCKLLLLSTSTDIQNIAFQNNATDYLSKPFDVKEFNLKVRKQLKDYHVVA